MKLNEDEDSENKYHLKCNLISAQYWFTGLQNKSVHENLNYY